MGYLHVLILTELQGKQKSRKKERHRVQ